MLRRKVFPVNWTASRKCASATIVILKFNAVLEQYLQKHLVENSCDWIIPYMLYVYTFEILLKSEEVRQSRSKVYDWKEEGCWNSRSSQRLRTSDAGNVLGHTIPTLCNDRNETTHGGLRQLNKTRDIEILPESIVGCWAISELPAFQVISKISYGPVFILQLTKASFQVCPVLPDLASLFFLITH